MIHKKVALVTGGTRGIGAGISIALKKAGYTVAATYHGNDTIANAFHKETQLPIFKWDVGDFEATQKGIEKVVSTLGPIEILVNNAGATQDSMFHKMTPDQWQNVMTTNLTSCFNLTRAIIGDMREKGFGRIINISSINGQKGQMGQTNYSAAKAGVLGFTKALALENASKGITVNAITPGYIETDMVKILPQSVIDGIIHHIPVKRLGTIQEIARAVVFLAAEEAGFITGSTFSMNGGQWMP